MAEDRRKKIENINDLNSERIEQLKQISAQLEREINSGEALFDIRLKTLKQEEYLQKQHELLQAYQEEINNLKQEGYEVDESITNNIEKRNRIYSDINRKQNIFNRSLKTLDRSVKEVAGGFELIWDYLMESDKAIRNTILNLGLSGEKAELMRASFEGSAQYVARLGGGLGDVQTIMETFANETGRARILTSEMVEDVYKIGKGTGLGVEQGARLAAQFEFMGLNAKSAMNYTQGVVETSELMGVNTTKVMNNITDNFKRLQTFTFKSGVKGFAKMAQYAEKFRVDIGSALDVAERARNLENVVDMTAQLQVMGGEFAKTDPFQMLYQARNAPEQLQKSIADMTKGLVTFKRNSEGVFETFISPADQDRLRQVAKTLGMSNEEITEIAKRTNKMQLMRQQMVGMGLSDADKDLIEGMADFNSQTGKFTIKIGQATKDIKNLTKNELEILKAEKSSLDERAKQAQTFDDVYKATIQEFKAILLPMLRGVNDLLKTIRPFITKLGDTIKEWDMSSFLKGAGILASSAILWKGVSAGLNRASQGLINAGKNILGSGAKKGVQSTATQTLARGKATGARAAGRGTGMLKGGLGIGLAGAGVGSGIYMAAEGISALADSMSKLDETQVEALKSIVSSLTTVVTIGSALVAVIGILSPVLGAASVPMLAFGTAAFLVGSAVGIAALGIGKMAEGFSTIIDAAKGAGPELFNIAGGISAIAGSVALMGAGGVFGLPMFAATLGLITKKSDDLERIGAAFGNINAVLRGSKEDFESVKNAITTISKADLSNLKQFKNLNKVLSGPIKVEFADKEVALVSNITLNMDGYEMTQRIAERVPIVQKEMSTGKESGRY
jgi:hypothetical protein